MTTNPPTFDDKEEGCISRAAQLIFDDIDKELIKELKEQLRYDRAMEVIDEI